MRRRDVARRGEAMSYLSGPRLHFAGRFGADVSTVNNYVTHFQNPNNPNDPGWNPSGSGGWSVSSCTVTAAVYADGTTAQGAAADPVIGMPLTQNGRACLVDLDPEQQLVSQIWGWQLQLGNPNPAFVGAFKATAFSDLFGQRSPSAPGDLPMGAFYQSRLTGVTWGVLPGSRLFDELKQASAPGLLSIKFNVDGFDVKTRTGRIVGTIGPALPGEPAHFVVGRHCMPQTNAATVWFFPAVVDTNRGKLIADFGNALQTTSAGGPIASTLNLQIGLLRGGQTFSSFGQLPIGPAGWYEQTAGICEFPAGRSLTAAELADLGTTPIAVVQQSGGATTVLAAEGSDGLHVRADDFVFRMSANDTVNVTLRASRFGQPLPNAAIAFAFDSGGLQQSPGDPNPAVPPVALSFPASVTTDAQGTASLPLSAHSIATPRGYVDGQIYGVRYTMQDADPAQGSYFNPADFLSVLVWTDYAVPAEPTWQQNVQPILGQYANLYAVMKGIVDLNDYDSVVAAKPRLQEVFGFPVEDARYMPVTRDLSPAKRQMILDWLLTTGNAGKPNLDAAPAPVALAAAAPESVAAVGAKTAALQRRLGRRA